LQTVLKQKDKLTVTTIDGTRVSGQLTEISDKEVVLQMNGSPQKIATDRVAKVERRQNGVLLGTLIGAGAAIPFAIIGSELAYNEGSSSDGAIGLIVLGTVAGMGIDAAIPSMKTVYDRNPKRRVTVAPVLRHGQVGGKVAINF